MDPKCAHYAPTMRPLCVHYVLKPFWRWADGPLTDGPKVRPLSAHYAPTMRINHFGAEPMDPKCAHYALTIRPLCPKTALELNRWA